MDIKDVNLSDIGVSDEFLTRWVKKDLTTGMHFCYLKIDKRNLTENFEGDESVFIDVYMRSVMNFAARYAFLSFEKDRAEKLALQMIDAKKIKELRDESEDTTWLMYEFTFMYVAESEKGEKSAVATASFVDCLKCDYAPRILAEKVKGMFPELKDMKPGDMKSVGKEVVAEVIKSSEAEQPGEK